MQFSDPLAYLIFHRYRRWLRITMFSLSLHAHRRIAFVYQQPLVIHNMRLRSHHCWSLDALNHRFRIEQMRYQSILSHRNVWSFQVIVQTKESLSLVLEKYPCCKGCVKYGMYFWLLMYGHLNPYLRWFQLPTLGHQRIIDRIQVYVRNEPYEVSWLSGQLILALQFQ